MKSLYQFLMEHDNESVKLYNLSYDICEKEDEDVLHNNTFLSFLYEQDILSLEVEFIFVDENNQHVDKEKYYVVKPSETTIIFGSKKSTNEILDELIQHEELSFSLQELDKVDDKIKGLVINNFNPEADKDLKNMQKEAEKHKDPNLERVIQLMGVPQTSIVKVRTIKM